MGRSSITNTKKQALRAWYRSKQPPPTQKQCIQWFEATYHHRLSQSTVSEYLSDHYLYLDSLDPLQQTTSAILTSKRRRSPQWPRLEQILFQWQQIIESKGGLVSSDLLAEKAREIWHRLPEYAGSDPPEFSVGWLYRFKKRHQVQDYHTHGEVGSVPEQAHIEMRSIRTLCGEYKEEDIYNMDTTGLFWRYSPSSGLSSQPQAGIKKDKARITLTLCTNFTGSDRLPVWIIGKAQQPHALRSVNLAALNIVWRANQKAWMNQIIMIEWLQWFYHYIRSDRQILLLMDNLKCHKIGVELAPPPENIRIQWLPSNSTSLYQPLDQGIIQNLKIYYKKQWLRYMIYQYEQNINPTTTMNLYNSLIWISRSWNNDIMSSTIYQCFRKSTILEIEPLSLPTDPVPDLSVIYQQTQCTGAITDAMSLSRFLNPEDENTAINADTDAIDDPLEAILAEHIDTVPVEQEEDDIIEVKVPSSIEALSALQLLLQYQIHQPDAVHSDIRALQRLEKVIQVKSVPQQQGSLDSWLITK
jgi:DDE superfamily endonuclease/Fission yeast centromere protein N-terminal domain/Tc5 transposase DNA-binding domain